MMYKLDFSKFETTLKHTYQAKEAKTFKSRYMSTDIEGAIESAVRNSLKNNMRYVVAATYFGYDVSWEGKYATPFGSFYLVDGLKVYHCTRILGTVQSQTDADMMHEYRDF